MAKLNQREALAMGVYNFHPRWTTNYSVSIQDRYREFEDVLKEGYFNSIIVEVPYFNMDEFWRIIEKYDCTVWLNIYDSFYSSKTSFEDWIRIYDDELTLLKSHPERWERFLGIHYDEPIWRGQSNRDFITTTKHFREKWGLRNFPVFATGEFTSVESNLSLDAEKMQKILPEGLKYVTDLAYDAYGLDVREGADYSEHVAKWQEVCNEKCVDARSYYIERLKMLCSMCDHEVNVWFFPTAYPAPVAQKSVGEITRADEGYCDAHNKFFAEALKEFDHPAGLVLYTYYKSGIVNNLVVTDENGNQKLLPEQEKWHTYSKNLKELCREFRNTKTNPIW